MKSPPDTNELTVGEFCAGIGGFGLGFEQAGWKTVWQVEIDDVNRTVLADRFTDAAQFKNIHDWRSFKLQRVRCVAFGSPCQDISTMGNSKRDKSRQGLDGGRSGLFFAIVEAIAAILPDWIVFENVPALLHSNGSRDLQAVVGAFAKLGYMGSARVLDAQYFGVPQKRRRLVMVAGLGRPAPQEFLADAGTMESIPCSILSESRARQSDGWAGYTLTAPDKYRGKSSRIDLCSEVFVAHEDGWGSMAERAREVELYGISPGLDVANSEQAYAAGNSFPPPIAKWIAEILKRE